MQPVDIIIPVYKAAEWIKEAVTSCLQPEVGRIIIIDDASPDSTPEACEQLAKDHKEVVAVLLDSNGGQYVACNTALAYLRPEAEFIGMQDADDLSHSNRFQISLDYLKDNPEIDIVGGRMESIRADGSKPETVSPGKGFSFENPDNPNNILKGRYGHVLTNGVMTLRRAVMDTLRGYEPSYGGSDTQFIIRAYYAGFKMHNINNKVLGYRRIHGNQCTTNAMSDPERNAYRQKQAGEWLWWQQLQKKNRLKSHYLQVLPATGQIKKIIY